MAKILDRLLIAVLDDFTFVGSERVDLKANVIIVWVSLSVRTALELKPGTVRFPAILATGHTRYLSIREQQLIRWAGLRPEMLRLLGHVRQGGRRLPLHAANL